MAKLKLVSTFVATLTRAGYFTLGSWGKRLGIRATYTVLWKVCVALAGAWAMGPGLSLASTLIINTNASDPAPRTAWERAVSRFRSENPDINVRVNVFDHESYRKTIRNWLTSSPPDVVFWFAGNRMRQFAELGLLQDVSDLFSSDVKSELFKSAIDLVTVGAKQYGVPYAHYHIGLFFRRDLLERADINKVPTDWQGLLATCEKLRSIGVTPIAIGTKDLWPAASWFDYLNLRTNGYEFHMDLMDGRIAYTDERVRVVFGKWRELLDRHCFVRHHAGVRWQESQAQLYQGKAAMMLMGNFIVPNFPIDVRDLIDFAPFPKINIQQGAYEEAPMNSLLIPSRAENPENAKRFLAFVLRADVQQEINQAMLTLPTNRKAVLANDRFLKVGRQLIEGADRLTQFFDRDTNDELATIAMKGFQEFMLKPERLDAVLRNIEQARARIYKQP
jgi:multiple sugar transport system substrate-binding protein